MGYRQSLEANSGPISCTKPGDILNSVLGRTSRVVKGQTIGLRMAKKKAVESDDESDDEEEEEKPELKPPPSRPTADPWTTGDARQIICGMEHPLVPNLCYVNTALQALAGTSYPEWVNATIMAEYADDPAKKDLATLVDGVFKQLNRFTTKRYLQRAIVKTPTTTELSFPDLKEDQHCAAELIARLNERIIENMNTTRYENRIEVDVLTRRNCLDCGNVWTQVEQYPSLQLHKPPKKEATLNETLEWHRRIEYWITGGCNRCKGLAIRKILRRALKNPAKDDTSAESVKMIQNRIQFLEQVLQNHTYNNLTDDEEKKVGLARRAPNPSRPTKTAGMTDEAFKSAKDASDNECKRRQINYESSWSQTQAITKLPDILLLEFVNVPGFDNRGLPIKLKSRVTFGPSTDFTEYTAGPNRNVSMGDFNLPIRISGDAANPAVPMYELRAILVHQGMDFRAGHWYCYRREWKDPTNPLSEQWWYCNEAVTLRVSKQDMFGAKREDPKNNRPGQMYALIYEKVTDGETVPDKSGDEGKNTNWRQATI
ncbi:uncharacterized protein DFL_004823 [Arthrobotrys flagrans]|uniref:USP domain-containing protein n=1 Tax=Arthrobotrys flagrans TaxID=97331 RepID=A0A437A5S2_ARTFL|nr:hypothetical protein DFL_004823 [Arthrobotrys flagrans]